MPAIAYFNESTSKYVVTFPDGSSRNFMHLEDVAIECDRIGCELHYKGKTA